MSRLFLDVSTLLRWSGPPVGMIRVESELARLGPTTHPPATLVFFDPVRQTFRALAPERTETLLGWHGVLDTWGIDYVSNKTGWRRLLPSRQPVMRALERRRLLTNSPLIARGAETLQAAVLGVRAHRTAFRDEAGTRISMIPEDLALGDDVAFSGGDTVLSASSDWSRKDPAALRALRDATGCRIAVVCYDIIPLTHPRFFPPADVAMFRRYWEGMFAAADAVIVNAEAIRRDIEHHCHAARLPPPSLTVVPLGCDPPPPAGDAMPPFGLEPDRYVLYVSTIEPRKNHAMLLDAWERLMARGIPAAHGFKLVLVGRPGWMVDEVSRRLAEPNAFAGSVIHLAGVDDRALRALYAGCAFCVYPSLYEGFGLPVVEAFAHGKAVVASTGGALREVAGDLGVVLDPGDIAGWEAALASWIEHPAARRAAETKARAGFKPRPWAEVAEGMLRAAGWNRLV